MRKTNTEKDRTQGDWHIYKVRFTDGGPVYEIQIRDANHGILAVTSHLGNHAGAPIRKQEILANALTMAFGAKMLSALRQIAGHKENGKQSLAASVAIGVLEQLKAAEKEE